MKEMGLKIAGQMLIKNLRVKVHVLLCACVCVCVCKYHISSSHCVGFCKETIVSEKKLANSLHSIVALMRFLVTHTWSVCHLITISAFLL